MSGINDISKERFAKLIVFDMDSTLIDAETIDELARAAGVADKVATITERAMNGELDYGEALVERVKLLNGLKLEDAMDAVDKMPLMTGARELIEYVKSNGYTTAMISGGFTLSADRVGETLGIDHVYSNVLTIEDGYLTGEVTGPLTKQDAKENVFEEIAEMHEVKPGECIVVGDGANDICIFKRARYAIAFNSKPILQQYANVVIAKKDLRAIIPVIESLNLE